jgi:Cu-processing system permease protein
MINTIALHKLAKLRHSRMILIFLIGGGCIAVFAMLPVILMGMVQGNRLAGAGTALIYFELARFFGLVAALMLGVTLWRQDEKDGTLLTFMARPLSRIELYLGKTLGCFYALLIYLAAVVFFYLLAHVIFFRFSIPFSFALYLVQELFYYLVSFAAGAFFSSFLKPLLASLAVLGWVFIGWLAQLFLSRSASWAQIVGKVCKFISLDDNISYSIQALLTADIPTITPLFKGIGYYLLWSVLLLSAAIVLFNKREFAGRKS